MVGSGGDSEKPSDIRSLRLREHKCLTVTHQTRACHSLSPEQPPGPRLPLYTAPHKASSCFPIPGKGRRGKGQPIAFPISLLHLAWEEWERSWISPKELLTDLGWCHWNLTASKSFVIGELGPLA